MIPASVRAFPPSAYLSINLQSGVVETQETKGNYHCSRFTLRKESVSIPRPVLRLCLSFGVVNIPKQLIVTAAFVQVRDTFSLCECLTCKSRSCNEEINRSVHCVRINCSVKCKRSRGERNSLSSRYSVRDTSAGDARVTFHSWKSSWRSEAAIEPPIDQRGWRHNSAVLLLARLSSHF